MFAFGKDDSLREGWRLGRGMIRFENGMIGMTKGMNDCLEAGMIPSELGRLDE